MSGRVNIKFVVLLSVVLTAVLGVAVALAAVVLLKSGADHARIAQNAQDAGDWVAAERSWGSAVSDEKTNVEFLVGFLNAIQQRPTKTQLEYADQFNKYRGVIRTIAEVKRTDLAAHERFFDELFDFIRSAGGGKEAYQQVIEEVQRVENLLFGEGDSDLMKNIRRYRGLATAATSLVSSDLNESFLDQGLKDLTEATAVRPDDYQIAEGLFVIHTKKAELARIASRSSEETAALTAAREAVARFTSANPSSVAGQSLLLRVEIEDAVRRVQAMGLFGPELARARRRTLDELRPRGETLASMALAAPAPELSVSTLVLMTGVLAQIDTDPEALADRLERIWDHAAESRPEDWNLQFAYASFLRQLGQHEEAIEIFDTVAALPNIPVSTEGFLRYDLRYRAIYSMADTAIERWTLMAGQSEGRGQWLDRARGYRDRLAKDVAEDRPLMKYLDARLAYAEGNLSRADRLFREFNTDTGRTNLDGLKLAAEVSNKLGNQGLERELLENALSIAPNDIDVLARLASVNVNLRNYQVAYELLNRANDLRPDIEAIKDMRDTVASLLDTSKETDPVKRVLADAQVAQDKGQLDQAIETIRKGLTANPDDVRLISGLAGMLYEAKRWEELRETVTRGLALDPENRNLQAMKTLADLGDDVEARIAAVENKADIPELDRQIALHQLYLTNKDPEAAKAALAAARAIDPQDRRVVIHSFDEAIRARDAAEAERIYQANKDRDIDGADGLAMRARVELAKGDKESAKRTLEAAVTRGSLNPVTMRLLADVQLDMGETFKALDNYKKAIAADPSDIDLLKAYIVVLVRLDRLSDALDTARTSLAIAQRDEQFREMWLSLEGQVGNKQLAYDRRIEIAEASPGDANNSAQLIALALDLRKFDEARQRLDAARAKKDSLLLASLDARYHADRSDMNAAMNAYTSFMASPANDLSKPDAYLAFGQFLIERGQIDRGLTTLRQAKLVQDPKNPVADAVLSDQLFELGRYEECIPVLQSLIAADFQVGIARSRLIECFVRVNKPDRAKEELAKLSDDERGSMTMLLMRADIATLEGNAGESSRLIDLAIQEYPENPLPFMKRATTLMRDRATLADAVDDLTRAIELNPANPDAYRFRSIVQSELGRTDDAARDVASSAEADPDNVPLRLGAVKRLLDFDREQMAADLVDTGLKRRPTDLALIVGAADLFATADRHLTALRFYELAWNQSKTFAVAQRTVSSILEQPRPDLRRAREITNDPAIASTESAGVYILRAQIEKEAGSSEAVRTNLRSAYNLVKDNQGQLLGWFRTLPDLLGSTPAALDYLAALDREVSLSPWAALFQGQLMLTEKGRERDGIQRITGVINNVQDAGIKLTGLKVRSMAHFNLGDHAAAADDMREGLAMAPNDPELNNNLAYTLAKYLGQPQEALPLAQKAVELDPNSRASFDTLGLVHLELGNHAEAAAALERALSLAQTDADRAPVLVHLARAYLGSGNKSGAESAVARAGEIISSGAPEAFGVELRTELEQLREQLRNQ